MQEKNSMKVQFVSQSINEAFARVVVSAFVAQLDPTVEEINDIKMAVSEAVTNSIIHGYRGKENGVVEVHCSYEGRVISIEVVDYGLGIANIDQAMAPLYTTSLEEERAGLGFTVMQSMMDELEVYSECHKGTTVKMKKSLGE
ncbi:anti-sigma F factor [Sporanaerobium hydrogeniformans]|uniref:Anti-sigma F factor n=1 Tax=Sporanaerobium hydrogeniformans TaxID=3072179 RepID=A0AC61DHI5_9FIRM|nr:anti-sigma F factor [Sporanaerobium hydrogeniformans]PHV72275.1 anti-sigma F factor [Sporanaerobium hydrogeniformans]